MHLMLRENQRPPTNIQRQATKGQQTTSLLHSLPILAKSSFKFTHDALKANTSLAVGF